jgi:hypothetical protein
LTRETITDNINNINAELEKKRAAWQEENAREFKADSQGIVCPLTKKMCVDANALAYVREKEDKAKEIFNVEKKERLDRLSKSAEEQKKLLEQQYERIENQKKQEGLFEAEAQSFADRDYDSEIGAIRAQLVELTNDVPAPIHNQELPGWSDKQKEIEEIVRQIDIESRNMVNEGADEDEKFASAKKDIDEQIRECDTQLATKNTIDSNNAKIKELNSRQTELAQQISDLKKKEFLSEKMETAQFQEVERRVNCQFTIVKFKLFEKQINGGTNPTCVATVKGVKYVDLNNAMKINAGLDIINTMCKRHNVCAPIFIDNAEAINNILDVDSQLVRLVVSNDSELVVVNG